MAPFVCVAGPVCLFRAAKKGGVSARTRVSEVGPLVWPFRGAEGACVALQYWGREVKGPCKQLKPGVVLGPGV